MIKKDDYKIVEHYYSGSQTNYLVVLEIKNPPPDRWPIVLYLGGDAPSYYIEWETVDQAKKGLDTWAAILTMGRNDKFHLLRNKPGYKGLVKCDDGTPWFYAKN